IAYIQTFSPRWKTETLAPPIDVPAEPPDTPESVSRGRVVYDESGCAGCHGEGGRGDGPTARGLQDEWGMPIRPGDLTQERMKCGSAPIEVYRVLMTGMNGTPMPSYADALTSDETWDLAH